MKADEYLARLQAQLKGLPPEKQKDLIEEIDAHLGEGLSDPRLGAGPVERAQRLETEMGIPEDMGRRMQNIHRHNRWIDYLLVVLPALILSPLITFVLFLLFPMTGSGLAIDSIAYSWGMRVLFLVHIVLIGAGIQRYRRFGSPGLGIYWLVETWWGVVALCLREQRWRFGSFLNLTPAGAIETIFWLAVLAGLGIGFIRMVVRARDPLVMVLGLMPFTVAVGNLVTGQMMISGGFPNGYHLPNWVPGYFGPTQIALVVWPALFFLFPQRPVRWLGLLVDAAPLALMNLVAAFQYPTLVLLWSLPVVLVLAGWTFDLLYKRQSNKAVVG